MATHKDKFEQIISLMKERQDDKTKTTFTISVLYPGAKEPSILIKQSEAVEKFRDNFYNAMSLPVNEVIVTVYRGTSNNAPIQLAHHFSNPLLPAPTLQGYNATLETPEAKQTETVVSLEKFYNDRISSLSAVLQKDFELKLLQIELKQKQDKIDELEKEIKEYEEYTTDLQQQIDKPTSKLSLGGIHVGELLSYAGENILKRNPGILKGILKINDEQFRGLWGEMESETKELQGTPAEQSKVYVTEAEQPSLSPEQQKHLEIATHLFDYFKKIPSALLRIHYEIISVVSTDESKLKKLYLYAQKLAGQTTEADQKKNSGENNSGTASGEKENNEEFNDDG